TLYSFTHKTFLEYFTALHIVRNNSTPEDLWRFLRPKISRRSWDVVAQLAVQILDEKAEGGSEKVLLRLLREAPKRKANGGVYLSFAARCLGFILPRPSVTRSLVQVCVDWMVTSGSDRPMTEHSFVRIGVHNREIMD